MQKILKKIIYIAPIVIIPVIYFEFSTKAISQLPNISTTEQIQELFPDTTDKIKKLEEKIIRETQKTLDKIYKINSNSRTFENTMQAFDYMLTNFSIVQSILQVLSLVSPDENIRAASNEATINLQNFYIDNISQNKKLYNALKEFEQLSNRDNRYLNREQKYFISEALDDYKRAGIDKSSEIQEKIKAIQKKLAQHEQHFEKNIACDNATITVSKSDLDGLDDNFINNLKTTDDGKYILGIDSPTVTKVLDECKIETTRQALWKKFIQRAYPANCKELNEIIKLRHELAMLLGYKSYAQYDIDHQMASNTENVQKFLNNLVKKVEKKTKDEMNLLIKNLPQDISLIDNKIKPWDTAYIKNYNKKKMNIDEHKISQYFPIDYTLPALLSIYEQLFSIKFETVKTPALWHKDIITLRVYKNKNFIGTILLDLYPRENKYSHAAAVAIVPSVKTKKGLIPAVILVIANFPKPTKNQPSLLKRTDVITFFHEFGHALHGLLGTTENATQSGTHVKGDFVEMPSQMLEQWMWEPEILKLVSSHYKTKEPLPDDVIQQIVKLKNFDSGDRAQGQVSLALASLNFYDENINKDIALLWQELHEKYRPHVKFDKANQRYCSFVHLTSYGAKYYGYLWAEVFALDLFEKFKENGLLNPVIGQFYIDNVIGKGGSDHPSNLIKNFLGREPNEKAFFRNLGV